MGQSADRVSFNSMIQTRLTVGLINSTYELQIILSSPQHSQRLEVSYVHPKYQSFSLLNVSSLFGFIF
jgi:hypothetical protein